MLKNTFVRDQRIFCLALVGLIAISGCGSDGPVPSNQVPTFPVSGVVKIDGVPKAGIEFHFFAEDKAKDEPLDIGSGAQAPHRATSDAEGKFSAMTYSVGDGLPVGKYKVALFWAGEAPPATGLALGPQDEGAMDPKARVFNDKYLNPVQSGISVTVEEGKPVDMGTLELTNKR